MKKYAITYGIPFVVALGAIYLANNSETVKKLVSKKAA